MGQLRRQCDGLSDAAVVDVDQAGMHVVQVQLGAVAVGMGADAAIADHQGLGSRKADHLMRADAAGGDLCDPGIVAARVPDAQNASAGGMIVFGGDQHIAILQIGTVAIEMPPLRRFQTLDDPPASAIHDQREGAGTAAKGHGLGPGRMCGGGMGAIGQIDAKGDLRLGRQPAQRKASLILERIRLKMRDPGLCLRHPGKALPQRMWVAIGFRQGLGRIGKAVDVRQDMRVDDIGRTGIGGGGKGRSGRADQGKAADRHRDSRNTIRAARSPAGRSTKPTRDARASPSCHRMASVRERARPSCR